MAAMEPTILCEQPPYAKASGEPNVGIAGQHSRILNRTFGSVAIGVVGRLSLLKVLLSPILPANLCGPDPSSGKGFHRGEDHP